tara:strand:- start:123 stop:233 length:111 start_codon:yes stop_codon:yes gene_type:complete
MAMEKLTEGSTKHFPQMLFYEKIEKEFQIGDSTTKR